MGSNTHIIMNHYQNIVIYALYCSTREFIMLCFVPMLPNIHACNLTREMCYMLVIRQTITYQCFSADPHVLTVRM